MKNTQLFFQFAVLLIWASVTSCSSGSSQAKSENSSDSLKDTTAVRSSEAEFRQFLGFFDERSLPYPDNFKDVSENEIPENLISTFIYKNHKYIENSSSSGILKALSRFNLPENRVGVIFITSNADQTAKSTWLFIFDSDVSFRCPYELEYSYKGASSIENTTSVISSNLHILTTTVTEEKDMVSDEWTSNEESYHFMINDDGMIVDSSYE